MSQLAFFQDSTTALAASGIFTGSWINTTSFTQGYIYILAGAGSDASGVLYVDFSNDGVNVLVSLSNAVNGVSSPLVAGYYANFNNIYTLLMGQYVRVRYVNGSTAQTEFSLYHMLMSE